MSPDARPACPQFKSARAPRPTRGPPDAHPRPTRRRPQAHPRLTKGHRRPPVRPSRSHGAVRHGSTPGWGTLAPELQRPPAGTIPDTPGSYQFKDRDGRVIYVGKAHSLRHRLANYFVTPGALAPRTRQMVAAAETVEWIEVRNEVEALFLEFNLIKKHKPRFNIRLKDD